jgi:DNA polymerase
MKDLLAALHLDAIIGLDWETYYADDYSLRKMSTTEYIVDPRFKTHMVSVQWHHERKARVLNPTEFKAFCRETDWKRTGMLAHHTQFDGLILSHHFKQKPAFYLDTLSMARPLMPITVGGSLDALCKAFGLRGKVGTQSLENVKGVRDMSVKQFHALAKYAGNDIEQTWLLFKKLLPYTTTEELRLIDLTVKMYAQPTLLVDGEMAQQVSDGEAAMKAKLLKKTRTDKSQLMSNPQFAALLEGMGVEVPLKLSKTTGEVTLALAKQDLAFKDLLKHPDKKVRQLVEARLANKSTLLETRAAKMATRATIGAQPVYLNYAGAHTGRWSGGDKANWQNITRGSDLRKTIHAPKGHMLIIADLAQIEARMTAWLAGQRDILDAFRAGKDVYALQASKVYGRVIDKATDPDERFVGKVCVLLLGFGGGHKRFADTLRIGAFGPSVNITDTVARDIVTAWRGANSHIVGFWRRIESTARSAFFGHQTLDLGPLTFYGTESKGFIRMPGGYTMRYDGIEADGDGMTYVSKYRRGKDGPTILRTCLHGGFLTENVVQALSRRVIAEHMLAITERIPKARIALTTHDEVLLVVPKARAAANLKVVKQIMSAPPEWAPDIPLAVDAHISEVYDK